MSFGNKQLDQAYDRWVTQTPEEYFGLEEEPEETEQTDRKHYIFVYGSLRQGLHNFDLLKGAKRVGNHWELHGFDLFSLVSYPAIYPSEDQSKSVIGEVYEVTDSKTLQFIDRMESGAGYDKRTLIVYEGQRPMAVSVYVYRERPSSEVVEHGDWKVYLELRDRNKVCVNATEHRE